MHQYLRGHQAVNDNPGSPPSGSPLETGLSGASSFGRRSFGEFNKGVGAVDSLQDIHAMMFLCAPPSTPGSASTRPAAASAWNASLRTARHSPTSRLDGHENFDDNDISAYSGKTRPGFEAMLAAMKDGEFDALLCWHTDRLYRSMADLSESSRSPTPTASRSERCRAARWTCRPAPAGWSPAFSARSPDRSPSTPRERRKRANAQKAASGDWVAARRPFGYTAGGIPVEPEAAAIRTAVADVLAGKSIRAVAREWNEQGLRTTGRAKQWTSPEVRRVSSIRATRR